MSEQPTALESIACALCGSTQHVGAAVRAPREEHALALQLPNGRSQWVVCTGCGLVFQCPRPRRETLEALYDGGEYHEIRGGVPEHYVQYSLRRSRQAIAWGLTQLGDNVPPEAGRAVDIGCGVGGALVLLRDRGWHVTGVEPDPQLARIGRERFGLDIRNQLFEPGSLRDEPAFDLAYSCHVWEHLPDPVTTTEAVRSVLRPDRGHFLVVVPTFRRARTNAWACFGSPHTYMYTDVTMTHLLEGAGFAVVTHRYAAGADSELWMLARAMRAQRSAPVRDDVARVQRELRFAPLRAPLGVPSRAATHLRTLTADPGDFARRAARWLRTRARRVAVALRRD
jgi:SAM-dependent methyltransferase